MSPLLTNEDRSQIRREVAIAVLGVFIGALTTFVNKFIETEYLFQRNLKVLEYQDGCTANSEKEWVCDLELRASGLNEIKGAHMSVVVQGGQEATVQTIGLASFPDFAPPDPAPQTEGSKLDTTYASLTVARLREPQGVTWRVKITSSSALTEKTIQRVVSSDDPDARIEEGGTWRWKRWIPMGFVGLMVPLVIALILLILM